MLRTYIKNTHHEFFVQFRILLKAGVSVVEYQRRREREPFLKRAGGRRRGGEEQEYDTTTHNNK